MLSLKLATLMTLISACRASEMCNLTLEFMQLTSQEARFTLTELTKTSKVKDVARVITFHSHDNDKLDVCACIVAYIEATKEIRQETSKLYISYVKPHKAIKTCNLARWLRTMLTMSGINSSVFKAHSTRSASRSKANKFGLSVEQILSKANWKSALTFQRFYNKPVQTRDEFAKVVLTLQE
ncbi:hypothetical protein FSP39_024492 [Pinctada imbricata]|uniref:Tyr recombinase domain-containing protein n=1 Tax=Pinctada imbricata TaxID=66713 RepID=A0AA89BQV0_PINIB|nr:hypothetical protein FSP39_024492 [Pinctada imbricata]